VFGHVHMVNSLAYMLGTFSYQSQCMVGIVSFPTVFDRYSGMVSIYQLFCIGFIIMFRSFDMFFYYVGV